MINLFWPVYQNLENTFNDLTHHIHFNDIQKDVFSSTIIDLILRASSEIESISKELYKIHGGPEREYLKFDEHYLKYLNSMFNLEEKEVYISHPNCFFSDNVVLPFRKGTLRNATNNRMDYGWNSAYQNLKHNRVLAIEYGSIKNLIEIFAALFLLNIYYKDEIFKVDKLYEPTNFDRKLGSRVFSINLSNSAGVLLSGYFPKNNDFERSSYIIKAIDEYHALYVNFTREQEARLLQEILNDERFILASQRLGIKDEDIIPNFWNILKAADVTIRDFSNYDSSRTPDIQYEAVLNKNQFNENPYTESYKSWTGLMGIITQDSHPDNMGV